MKNICFLNSTQFWGGGEKLYLENAIQFSKKKYNIFLLINPASVLWQKAILEKIQTVPIQVTNFSFLNPIKIVKLIWFLKQKKIDTLIFSSSPDLKLASIAARIIGIKRIVYLRGLAIAINANFLNRIIFRSFLTHIIANSAATKRAILQYLGKYIKETKVHIIYHGLDISRLNNSKKVTLEEIEEKGEGVILGTAGRLVEEKGHDNLLKIAQKMNEQNIDFTLFIAGAGPLQSKLQLMIEKFHLAKKVYLVGFISNIDQFMNSIDVFLLTSNYEGFGYVLVEAMSHSKPVVSFNVGGPAEIVADQQSGFLVDYLDLDMFSARTVQLIQDKKLRHQMGQAGLAVVYKKFALQDRINELEAHLLHADGLKK